MSKRVFSKTLLTLFIVLVSQVWLVPLFAQEAAEEMDPLLSAFHRELPSCRR